MSKKLSPENLEEQIVKNIQSFISFIESKNLYYYIGQTNEPDRRLKEHNKTKGFKEMFVLVKHSKETIDYLEHYIISLYFDNKYCLNTQNYSNIKKDNICFKPYKSNDFYVYVSLKEQIDLKNINKNISLINVYSIINKNNNISVISILNNDKDKNISSSSKSSDISTNTSTTNSSSTISLSSSDEIIDETIEDYKEDKNNKKDNNKKDNNKKEDVKGDLKELPTKNKTKIQTKQKETTKRTSKKINDENKIKQNETKQTKTKSKELKEPKEPIEPKKTKETKENKDKTNKKIRQIELIDIDKINNIVKNLIQTINKNIIRKEGVKPFTKLRLDLCKDYKYTMHKICYKKKIDDDNIKQLYKSSNGLELSQIFYELKKYYHKQKEIDIKLDNFFCFLSTPHSCKDNNIIYFYLY